MRAVPAPRKNTLTVLGRAALLAIVGSAALLAQDPSNGQDPTPQSLDEFRTAAARVLQEGMVPGAGISLVRTDGVEWEGGIGLADRDYGRPVTADTHFRVGSISHTFVAIAIMRMYYDDELALEDTIEELAPEIAIDNPWHPTHPVKVIHLLQHSAGFADTHFNEMYNLHDPPALPLAEVMKRNPNSRRVRWQPGTRMSYSNPGYALAGYLVEKLTGEPYEDYMDREILQPLGMTTSSFRLTPQDEALLAQGYSGGSGPPTGFPQIYLRPAGNLHSSAQDMGRFVRMLLNWGELGDAFIIDPEYLGNMERSSTTRAALAGLRTGYGSGVFWDLSMPYPVIGYHGAVEGFQSAFGYSPARDVGYVILTNSETPAAARAVRRIGSLAIRYLKRDVQPPGKPEIELDARSLDRYTGFYRDANPRNQLLWPMQRLFAGRTVYREGSQLHERPLLGQAARLVPVADAMFRREGDLAATIVFTVDETGGAIMTGAQLYAERQPRWRHELLRAPLLLAGAILFSPLLAALAWVARLEREGYWDLKGALLACPLVLMAGIAPLALTPVRYWGAQNGATMLVYVATLALPTLVLVIAALAIGARRRGAGPLLTAYATLLALAAAGLSVFLAAHDLIGLRLWSY